MLGVGRDGARGEWRVAEVPTARGDGPAFEPEPPAARPAGLMKPGASRAPTSGLARPAGSPSLDEADAWAALVAVDGIGPVTLGAALAAGGSGRAVLEMAAGPGGPARLADAVAARGGRLDIALARAIADAAQQAPALAARVRGLGITVVTIESTAYPERLRLLDLPPPVLFLRGDPSALHASRSVAVVGTRRASERGRRIAGAIGGALASAGALVVSGLAVGIDGAAHAAAVASGGRTVAVLGSGHERLYPRAHAHLADEIVAGGGAIVSELAPDVGPLPGTFPRRNRVISGLADASVIVEAGERSGALITASWTLEQGRECFVVPGPIDVPQSVGCNRMLRLYPGQARAVPGVAELLEDLGLMATDGPPRVDARSLRAGRTVGPDPEAILAGRGTVEAAVARALLPRAATLQELVDETGHAPATILAILTRLENDGLVVAALGRYAVGGSLAATTPTGRRTHLGHGSVVREAGG